MVGVYVDRALGVYGHVGVSFRACGLVVGRVYTPGTEVASVGTLEMGKQIGLFIIIRSLPQVPGVRSLTSKPEKATTGQAVFVRSKQNCKYFPLIPRVVK